MSKDPTYMNASDNYAPAPPAYGQGQPTNAAGGYDGAGAAKWGGQISGQQGQGGWPGYGQAGQAGPAGQGQSFPGFSEHPQGFKVNKTPGQQSRALKIRLGFMVFHLILAITICLVTSIITRYTPFIICSAGGAGAALLFTASAGWQSVVGGKHRAVDRVDSEIWYYISQIFVWAVLGGLNAWVVGEGGCPSRLPRRIGRTYGPSVVCPAIYATIALSFLHVAILLGWTYWFTQMVKRAGKDDKGRQWRASTSKLLRDWY